MGLTELAVWRMASVLLNTTVDSTTPSLLRFMISGRAQNRPVDETDFADVKLLVDNGLQWVGVDS